MQQWPRSRMIIFESELEVMAGNAAAFGERETGGELYGYYGRNGYPVVMLATGPGPMARHLGHHFQQDIDCFRRTYKCLTSRYALEYLGRCHSHHTMGLFEPSRGDVRSLCALANRNGIQKPLEVIVTHSAGRIGEVASRYWYGRAGANRELVQRGVGMTNAQKDPPDACLSVPNVSIHPYVYTNTSTGEYERCLATLLPGDSPIRYAATHQSEDSPLSGILDVPRYPRERIRLAGLEQPIPEPVPDALLAEFAELEESVKEGAEVIVVQGGVVFSLPLLDGGSALLLYEKATPHRVSASVRTNTGSIEHIEANTLHPTDRPRMIELYARARREAVQHGPKEHGDETRPLVARDHEGGK